MTSNKACQDAKRFGMKKVKFYFVFSLIVVFLSVIGILLGMVLVTIEQKHPEYLSAGIFKGIIIFFMALLVTVCFHELAHAIAFKLQKYSYDCHISNMFNKRKRRFKVSYSCKYGDWIWRNCHTGDTNN